MKPFLIVLLLLLIPNISFSQTISGKIVNRNQQPIQEANILNTSTDNHTHSNELGEFTIENCTVGDSLKISYVGYQTEIIEIKSLQKSLTIVLKEKVFSLNEVVIAPKLNALHIITDIDIQTHPVNSSQEILQKVPGLFIGQHAGGGKAEQIFLRGFDIDHGTDIDISVDGLPVNMVSHAHGQGYADLHFLIPETIEKIDFGKGPYYGNKGNFTTAGYVDFSTKQKLENNTVKFEAGQFDTFRMLGMFNLIESNNHNGYVATEYLSSDGYFDSSQHFNRINLFGKYTGYINHQDKVGVTIAHFDSKWDASGQIPQRVVDEGLIARFGAVDDTEGGITSRSNFSVNFDKIIDENTSIKNLIFISKYNFELYSNFTFFLEDPIYGDQIKQKENRTIYGLTSEYNKSFFSAHLKGNWQLGFRLRNDKSKNNELSHTFNRSEVLDYLKLGDINETNIASYFNANFEIGKWTFNPSIRLDYFNFQYNDKLNSAYKTQEESKAIIGPKFNVLYNPSDKLQLYLKTGQGFHSNDTRVVIANEDKKTLPAALGLDLGYIWKPTSKMLLNMAYWYLHLEQEFVYVGDAGIVEPSGKTKRQGIDVSYRYQPLSWLTWNFDANYTLARAMDEPKDQDYIPLAPDFTLMSGLNFNFESGYYGNLHVRHLANRPANEDNSIIAEGYTVTDFNMGYQWKNMNVGIQIQNLFDTEWNETQFATESRLSNEIEPVEEIHFTPGTPFLIKAVVQYTF